MSCISNCIAWPPWSCLYCLHGKPENTSEKHALPASFYSAYAKAPKLCSKASLSQLWAHTENHSQTFSLRHTSCHSCQSSTLPDFWALEGLGMCARQRDIVHVPPGYCVAGILMRLPSLRICLGWGGSFIFILPKQNILKFSIPRKNLHFWILFWFKAKHLEMGNFPQTGSSDSYTAPINKAAFSDGPWDWYFYF